MARDTPLHTKRKRNGYQPITPVPYDHPRGQEAPTKTPTVTGTFTPWPQGNGK